MIRYFAVTLISVLAGASALQAQNANPLSSEAQQAYNSIKRNLEGAAEAMPEADYDFKPTPEIRTFSALVAHVADAQTRTCSAVNGQAKQPDAASKKTKAELVAAFKASFDECDKAYGSLTDANATQMLPGRGGQRTKLGVLTGNTIHDNEEYGYMAVYLRLKGVTPPSSERRR
ncbi:MAG TPA: DinB family protein [Bryobacteraceae bacterium]|nr:DinB family protein [Bryobacteraceae bacterium]